MTTGYEVKAFHDLTRMVETLGGIKKALDRIANVAEANEMRNRERGEQLRKALPALATMSEEEFLTLLGIQPKG
jgi:hypothetical protein